MKIMLDAGHYGNRNQSPAVPEYSEAKQMWKLHLLLKSELESYGFEVDTTRKNQEKDLAVVKRGKAAMGYDLFLSLHSNAVGSSKASEVNRVDVYYPYDNQNDSRELASALVSAIAECMGVDKGSAKVRKSEEGEWEYYGVLRGARSVGCPYYFIIEHSFHTNEQAAKWLLDDNNLQTLARIEATVIALYFGIKKPYEMGDVDMNGRFDNLDVLLIKRAFFGTVLLTDEQFKLADLDGNGEIDVFDYLAAKRKFFKE